MLLLLNRLKEKLAIASYLNLATENFFGRTDDVRLSPF